MARNKETKSTKHRRTYTRRGIVHICFAGAHWAPSGATGFRLDKPITRVELGAAEDTVLVFQSVNRKKATQEVWARVVIPRRPRRSRVEKFRAAAAAQLKAAA